MISLLHGDARAVLATLPAASVHCCVTSPPYYALRAYGSEPVVWGGDAGCGHEWQLTTQPPRHSDNGTDGSTLDGGKATQANTQRSPVTSATCALCGAWRGELGQEPTLAQYLANLVEVFRHVRRVLHPTGLLFVNLGDSYSGGGGYSAGAPSNQAGSVQARGNAKGARNVGSLDRRPPDRSCGQLCMVPARFALAMQEAGWRLRSAITLVKPAPMPESVAGARWERCQVKVKGHWTAENPHPATVGAGVNYGREGHTAEWSPCPGCPQCTPHGGYVLRWGSGRPTSATEMLYVFAATSKYFWNQEAVRTPHTRLWDESNGGGFAKLDEEAAKAKLVHQAGAHRGPYPLPNPAGANARNWLMWKPQPLADAHYAAYPPWLPTWCIKAGTAEQVCGACKAPYAPVVEREFVKLANRLPGRKMPRNDHLIRDVNSAEAMGYNDTRILAWRPTCSCNADPGPATVLDPFSGAGTTIMAADRLCRHGIGIDVQEEYHTIARKRMTEDAGLFAEWAEAQVEEPEVRTNGHGLQHSFDF